MKIKSLAFIYFFIASAVQAEEFGGYSENYESCIASANGEHPSMINCIEHEIELNERAINIMLNTTTGDEIQIKILVSIRKTEPTWAKYIVEKCTIYLELGGQRGELLQKNCEADATIERSKYIKDLLVASEI